jgi:hypothetical protein
MIRVRIDSYTNNNTKQQKILCSTPPQVEFQHIANKIILANRGKVCIFAN